MLYAAAGLCLFLVLLNRVLILIPDSRAKGPVILAASVVLVGIPGVSGLFLARSPWVFAPLTLLALVLVGEIRQAVIRRSCAGSPPEDTTPLEIDLTTPVTTRDLVVHRYKVPHPKWRGEPLRIVQLTDLHVHHALPIDYYREVVSVAVGLEADIGVVTGDFITTVDALPELAKVLRPIAGLETYAVLGNHDYWSDPDAVRKIIRESGLHLLSDESVSVVFGQNEIAISGCDYPWGGKDASIAPQRDDMLHVVLSHTPDNIYRISRASGDIVFSGHYHAGQIRLPVLGPVVIPSIYGRRFDHGHFIVNNTHLFVASGVGAAAPPVRIYCQPDIFVVDIIPDDNS